MDRSLLAAELKLARSRLRPRDVGLASGSGRRVPGLRREEVAMLAGISVDYLVRLEQGRGPGPSTQVLQSLARALRMSTDERDHLFHLAGAQPPTPDRIDTFVRPSTQRLLHRLVDLPAMVLDAKGDLLASNGPASALLGDITALPAPERNFARLAFLGGEGRVVYENQHEAERAAAQTVADLRATAARYPDDPDLVGLLRDLRAGSELFARLWAETRVAVRRSAVKTFDHPSLGRLRLDCDVAVFPDTDQRLIVYSAEPGTPDADALDLLRVIGIQEMERSNLGG